MFSWTLSRSQMSYLFMLQHLGFDIAQSLQQCKLVEELTDSWLAGCIILEAREAFQRRMRQTKEWMWGAVGTQLKQKLWVFMAVYECNNMGGWVSSCFISRVLVLQNSNNSLVSICTPEMEVSVKEGVAVFSDGAVSIRVRHLGAMGD